MTIPVQDTNQQLSPSACLEPSEVILADDSLNHNGQGSAEKTSAALLALYDSPAPVWAAAALWDENHETIEHEMALCLYRSADEKLRERVLSGVVSQARFFCLEVDDPKAWVARCANLEARRVALTLKK